LIFFTLKLSVSNSSAVRLSSFLILAKAILSVGFKNKTILKEVEDALATADLGINPQSDGVAIRMTMPSMTEERRKEIGKIAHELGEHARISIRQQRQKAHDAFKEEANEDVHHRLDKELQEKVDEFNKQIETDVKHKEEEILKV
jgi:ribosome recycling factor